MIEKKIRKNIARVTGLREEEIILEKPRENFGDFSFPCFRLSRLVKKNPKELAEEIATKLGTISGIEKVEAVNGYVNFFVKKDFLIKKILEKVMKEEKVRKKKKVILVESPGPNTNKPLHIGHLRNLFIGDSIARLFEFFGYDVKRIDTINDRGIHICKAMLAYKKWGKNKKPNKKPDHFVGDFYVLFSKKVKENPELEKEAYELLRKWEMGDKEVRRLWKKINSWALKGIKQTYKLLGFRHDKQYFESESYEKGREIVLQGLKKGIFQKREDNAIVADLGELGKKVLLRPDGTTVYITQDIYLAKKRYEDYKFEKLIYVVASEQNHHFKCLFKILEMLGYKWVKKLFHLSYGMVNLPEGKMKSREGIVVDADELIEEMLLAAKEELKKRYNLKEKELEKRALAIALGALRFFLLRTDIKKDILFQKQEALDFEGFSGPYLQYSYARASSILRKAKKKIKKKNFDNLHEIEIMLVKKFEEFSSVIKKAKEEFRPDFVALYAYELAQLFNNFYHSCPVLKANREYGRRIAIVLAFKKIISRCLWILGIKPLERM